jgi:hypothetical protein
MTRRSPNRGWALRRSSTVGRAALESWAGKNTALAGTESIDHASVDVTGLGQDFGPVLDPPGNGKIGGVVDHGLDANACRI